MVFWEVYLYDLEIGEGWKGLEACEEWFYNRILPLRYYVPSIELQDLASRVSTIARRSEPQSKPIRVNTPSSSFLKVAAHWPCIEFSIK